MNPEVEQSQATHRFERGNILVGLGQYEEALASYRDAISLREGCTHVWEPNIVDLWVACADALVGLERYAEALESYQRARNIEPNATGVWVDRIAALQELQRYEEALAGEDSVAATESLERAIALLETLVERGEDAIARLVLADLEDEMAWDVQFANSQNALAKLAAEATVEYRVGRTQELDPETL